LSDFCFHLCASFFHLFHPNSFFLLFFFLLHNIKADFFFRQRIWRNYKTQVPPIKMLIRIWNILFYFILIILLILRDLERNDTFYTLIWYFYRRRSTHTFLMRLNTVCLKINFSVLKWNSIKSWEYLEKRQFTMNFSCFSFYSFSIKDIAAIFLTIPF
jgi:hypothetical protein